MNYRQPIYIEINYKFIYYSISCTFYLFLHVVCNKLEITSPWVHAMNSFHMRQIIVLIMVYCTIFHSLNNNTQEIINPFNLKLKKLKNLEMESNKF